ncbi:serine hydrolase domain-containing protein [Steroidobacter sp.]|uniref:serine hydrolase domain-containing protein n=1 Tax=Steroidobacter sp. TaxID=1978227 RepID=UPI001A3CB7D2|nr:serine hydrolase domain-containing protein [Steroidobacter sp.]MBL8264836.1 beta-lactamase family protein [Steroidobacter sp.]
MSKLKTALLASFAALLATNASAADDLTQRVDEIFKDWARTDGPGCAVTVSQDGKTVLERAYGMADLEQGVANRPDTVFNIASLSKQFTAVSLLLLQEQGKLSLDDDIRKYVSEVPDYGTRITLRHLANHTSGLRDLPEILSLGGWNWVDAVPQKKALDAIARQKNLNFAPGSQYLYSNSGYYLMAVIVERVSGQTFGEFTRDHIFQPLGMLHSRFYDDRRMIMKSRAIGHMKLPGGGFGVWRPTYEIVGDGALLTTAQDLQIWARNFLEPKLGRHPQQLLADMTQAGVLNDGKKIDYALGLSVEIYRGSPAVSHGGGIPGYATFMLHLPEQKFASIVLCNVGGGPARKAAGAIADIYLEGKFPNGPEAPAARSRENGPTKAERQPTVAQLQKLAGTYYSEELDASYILSVDGDHLVATVGYEPPAPLFAIEGGGFYNDDGNATLQFSGNGFEMSSGRVQGLKFKRTSRR